MNTAELLSRQRAYFASGATLDVRARIAALKKLEQAIRSHESDIAAALSADLGKSAHEAYMTETGMALSELRYMLRHIRALARPRRAHTPLALFPAHSKILREPYGCTLVMSPWNYPLLLTLDPVIASVAAGNTVLVKPSAYAPHTGELLKQLLSEVFPPEHVAVALGGREVNADLLDQRFDYIFFTGGKTVGRLVLEKAARHITPVTLELGGKSPCIVTETADIPLAARRIVFGKFLNAGQTCVAPDYVLVQESVRDALIDALRRETERQFGPQPLKNPNYGKIINSKHLERLKSLIEPENVLMGGTAEGMRIAPTLLASTLQSPCMQEEIFGPILPIIPYATLQDALALIEEHPFPLALYLFTESTSCAQEVFRRVRFGGGCLNDTIMHLATTAMPFGGVGESGMGSYHGRRSFETFTHEKSILSRGRWPDVSIRYQPYTKKKFALLRRFQK